VAVGFKWRPGHCRARAAALIGLAFVQKINVKEFDGYYFRARRSPMRGNAVALIIKPIFVTSTKAQRTISSNGYFGRHCWRMTMTSFEFWKFWTWGKENDVSNWFVLVFSLIAWPITLHWYFNRSRQGVPHLNVSLRPGGQTTVEGKQFPSLDITFTNQTGQVVYLSRARLRGRRRLQIPLTPTTSGWYDLKFAWSKTPSNQGIVPLQDFECILQTGETALTNIAARRSDDTFLSYRPWWFRRWLWWPKYFRMQYTAMVGEKQYKADTVY
jgi:hypothetical protein